MPYARLRSLITLTRAGMPVKDLKARIRHWQMLRLLACGIDAKERINESYGEEEREREREKITEMR